MTKTESYANHCVETDAEAKAAAAAQLSIPFQESTMVGHESAINYSLFYSARVPRSLSNDSFQRPTSSLMDHQTTFSSYQLNGFDLNHRKLKTNYTMSNQSNDVAAIKSQNLKVSSTPAAIQGQCTTYSPEDSKKLIHSPEMTNAESRTMKVLNLENYSRNQSFGIGTKSFELHDPSTANFHEKIDEPLQSNQFVPLVAEILWNTPATSGNGAKPSKPYAGVVTVTSSDDTQLQLMPVTITYGKTNRNTKFIQQTTNATPMTEFNEPNVCDPASDELNESTVPVIVLKKHYYGQPAQKNSVAPSIQNSSPSKAALLLEEHWRSIEGIPSTSKATFSELIQLAANQKKSYGRSNGITKDSKCNLQFPLKNRGAIPMVTRPQFELALKNAVTVQTAAQSKLQPKNATTVPMTTQSKLQPPIRNGANSYATPVTVTSMKRKNVQSISPATPSKIHDVAGCRPSTFSLPGISIQHISVVKGVKRSVDIAGIDLTSTPLRKQKDKSLPECLEVLDQNNVSMFKVQANKAMDRFMKVLEMNGVSVERVNKR